jgi:thiamine transporter ThiT
MVLVIVLALLGIGGIIYGMAKNNRRIVMGSIIGMIVLTILLLAYSYLYAQNPY